MSDKPEWTPARSGSYTAFEPQFWDKDKRKWRPVSLKRPHRWEPSGVPQPLLCGGINMELGLCGYDQAMALAHWFAAEAAAEGVNIDVRVQEYDVQYDLKARRCEENSSIQERYSDLLYQVDKKIDGETRHETARRWLAEHRQRCAQAGQAKEVKAPCPE